MPLFVSTFFLSVGCYFFCIVRTARGSSGRLLSRNWNEGILAIEVLIKMKRVNVYDRVILRGIFSFFFFIQSIFFVNYKQLNIVNITRLLYIYSTCDYYFFSFFFFLFEKTIRRIKYTMPPIINFVENIGMIFIILLQL